MVLDWRLAVVAAYTIGLAAILADLDSPWSPVSLGTMVVAILPIALLCLWRGLTLVKGFGAIVIGGAGLGLIYHGLYVVPPDPQSVLVLFFVPVLQFVATAVFAVAVVVVVNVLGKEER